MIKKEYRSLLMLVIVLAVYACGKGTVGKNESKDDGQKAIITSENSYLPEYIGIWEDIPMSASGWGDVYRFFKDGTYVFNYSQMSAEPARIIYIKGKYSILGEEITFIEQEKKELIGGIIEESGMGKHLVGATEQVVAIKDNDPIITRITRVYDKKIEGKKAVLDLKAITIGKKEYYLKNVDPNKY